MIVHLVRHGQSFNTHRPDGEPYPPNPPLTPTGVAEAERLAHRLGGISVDRLMSSPLRRSVETALVVAPAVGLTVEILASCYEHRYQPGYLSWGARELRARYPSLCLHDDLGEDDWYYGEEPLDHAVGRADAFLEWLRQEARRPDARQLVVVTHGAFTRVVLSRILSMDPRQVEQTLVFDHTSVTTLSLDGDAMRVLAINDTSHLSSAPALDPLREVSR